MAKKYNLLDVGVSTKDLESEVNNCMQDVGTEETFGA